MYHDRGMLPDFLANAGSLFLVAAFFVLVILLPGRVLCKRHGYSSWILGFGFVPYLGPFLILWGLALSSPRNNSEAMA